MGVPTAPGMSAVAAVVRDTFPVQATLPYRTNPQQPRIKGGHPSILEEQVEAFVGGCGSWGSRSRRRGAVVHPILPLLSGTLHCSVASRRSARVMSLGSRWRALIICIRPRSWGRGLGWRMPAESFLLPLRSFGSHQSMTTWLSMLVWMCRPATQCAQFDPVSVDMGGMLLFTCHRASRF